MSRFKELNRINEAIKHKNKGELGWAKEYCNSRLSFASLKPHQKHWETLLKKVDSAIEEI